MAISINKIKAERILSQAFGSQCLKNDQLSTDIQLILTGNHLTFKYLLLTGLLAKATDEEANPLALQAQSTLVGAYDARSLCHEVLVPFERDYLQNALGGSNEPFLNKPARYTEISTSNPVRKGNDRILQGKLVSTLSAIETADEAFAYLACGLYYLQAVISAKSRLTTLVVNSEPTLIEIYTFIERVVSRSFEGETCAIVIGALETLYYSKLEGNYSVVPHKVNQSGASSRETGDIDIIKDDTLVCAIEVKDKNFNVYDLDHAFHKMKTAGAHKGEFIYGTHAEFDGDAIFSHIAKLEKDGFYILFHSVLTYAKMALYKIDLRDKTDFIQALFKTVKEIQAKQPTLLWIDEVMQSLGWREAD